MITIRIHQRGKVIERIQIRGHAMLKKRNHSQRVCTSVSVLSRTLLHILGIDSPKSKYLKKGFFDVTLDARPKTQQAARFTVEGYRMVAGYVPHQVRMRCVRLDEVSHERGSSR
jgi:uncharacterized protein YsxB (DUF464 family)